EAQSEDSRAVLYHEDVGLTIVVSEPSRFAEEVTRTQPERVAVRRGVERAGDDHEGVASRTTASENLVACRAGDQAAVNAGQFDLVVIEPREHRGLASEWSECRLQLGAVGAQLDHLAVAN